MIAVRLQANINIPTADYHQLRQVVAERGLSWPAVQDELAQAAQAAAAEAVRMRMQALCGDDPRTGDEG